MTLSDYCIYWRNFAKDCQFYEYHDENPISDWRTSATWLFDSVRSGDWFWFFTSGEKCEMSRRTAAYLVSLFQVLSREPNQGDDPPYSPADFKYTMRADKSRCIWVAPPLLVDEIIRPSGHAENEHIGNLLQGPKPLSEQAVSRLKKKLGRERRDVLAQLRDWGHP